MRQHVWFKVSHYLCSYVSELRKTRKKCLTVEDVRVVIHKVDVFQIPFCVVVKLLTRQQQIIFIYEFTWGKIMSPIHFFPQIRISNGVSHSLWVSYKGMSHCLNKINEPSSGRFNCWIMLTGCLHTHTRSSTGHTYTHWPPWNLLWQACIQPCLETAQSQTWAEGGRQWLSCQRKPVEAH